MALKNHKKTITRIFILLVVMTLICMGVFACTNYLEQQSKAFVDMSKVQLIQLDEPESDAPAMKITTTAGTIVAELFPEQAPAYVKQFTELAESGYYDDTYVFSVEKGVYFEAGSPNADGSLNSDADGTYEKVERETSGDLWPFRGAFCVPTTSKEGNILDRFTDRMTSYCGTRFVVCNSIVFDDSTKEELQSVSENAEKINDAFLERGGVPNYSQQMTVFAQAYGDESFDTIDKITEAATQPAATEGGYTPPEDEIRIQTIEIGTYGEFADTAENTKK